MHQEGLERGPAPTREGMVDGSGEPLLSGMDLGQVLRGLPISRR